jgi:hypothetical protein
MHHRILSLEAERRQEGNGGNGVGWSTGTDAKRWSASPTDAYNPKFEARNPK